MKQLCLCMWLVINTTKPLVIRTLPYFKTPQIVHDSSATITSEVIFSTLHPPHISESFFNPQHVEHQWTWRSKTSYKIVVKIRTLLELWLPHDILLDSEKDPWLNHTFTSGTVEKQNLQFVRSTHRRLQR